ncbi:uncharacterized protein F4822DRAFT_442909 [Hypoxylon trugodes]|uniref:uncharacterized protein n=1 Tax=Hypoxylon trugodes TaxID=326681 RepID=UPI00219097FE|nr:uncharacterized protein F4822DRAFT_442909 [Hypoxylon trugodes]KAI1389708.1 hypothetical protein F4822DRAFT_442909 [Hypoxylon trugodes]
MALVSTVQQIEHAAHPEHTQIHSWYLPRPLNKYDAAWEMFQTRPELWFTDDCFVHIRDINLAQCGTLDFVDYGNKSYLGRLCYSSITTNGEIYKVTWDVRGEDICKELVNDAGGSVVGLKMAPSANIHNYGHFQMDVKFDVPRSAVRYYGAYYGVFSGVPTRTRILKGPKLFCHDHSVDIMIMYECTLSAEGGLLDTNIADYKWDLMLMRFCDNHDHPWHIMSVAEAGRIDEGEITEERHSCYHGYPDPNFYESADPQDANY